MQIKPFLALGCDVFLCGCRTVMVEFVESSNSLQVFSYCLCIAQNMYVVTNHAFWVTVIMNCNVRKEYQLGLETLC
jgi:hypothetical protein